VDNLGQAQIPGEGMAPHAPNRIDTPLRSSHFYCAFCSSVTVAMEADSTGGMAASGSGETESDASATAAGAGADEEASIGDNSLTSCDDDLSAPAATPGGAEETGIALIGLQFHHQTYPSSSIVVPPHSSSSALGNSCHTLASGLPSTLQLCKVTFARPPRCRSNLPVSNGSRLRQVFSLRSRTTALICYQLPAATLGEHKNYQGVWIAALPYSVWLMASEN